MSHPGDSTPHAEFGATYWEERYRSGEATRPHQPSPSLVAEASELVPGRALDAGCGRGADVIWLETRGWHVTALDVSGTVLGRAREAANAAGEDVAGRIDWMRADLTAWEPGERRFDLVTSHYVHVPGPATGIFGRLAAWVAPGGTLLVCGHDDRPRTEPAAHTGADHGGHRSAGGARPGAEPGHQHVHPPGARIRTDQVTVALPADRWEILVAESRTHTVARPVGAGAVTLHDVVVRARRTGMPRR